MADLNGITDPQGQVVDDPNQGEPNGDPTPEGGTEGVKEQEVTEPAGEKKPQSPEENAAFREMRLKIEAMEHEKAQAQRDALYAKKYPDLGVSTEAELKAMFGEDGIETYEDVDAYYENLRKAEQMEVSPQLLKVIEDLTGKVEALSKEKQDLISSKEVDQFKETMSKDETIGEIYKANESEIISLAEKMGMLNEQGLKAAMAAVLTDKFPTIIKEMNEKLAKAKEEGVKEYFEKKKNEVPIEGTGAPPASVGQNSQDPWKTARQSALEALRGTR